MDPAGAGFAPAPCGPPRPACSLSAFLGAATVQTNEVARGLAWLLPACFPAGRRCAWWNWGPAPGSTWWPTGAPSASPMRPADRFLHRSRPERRATRSWSWPRVSSPGTSPSPAAGADPHRLCVSPPGSERGTGRPDPGRLCLGRLADRPAGPAPRGHGLLPPGAPARGAGAPAGPTCRPGCRAFSTNTLTFPGDTPPSLVYNTYLTTYLQDRGAGCGRSSLPGPPNGEQCSAAVGDPGMAGTAAAQFAGSAGPPTSGSRASTAAAARLGAAARGARRVAAPA